MDTPMVEMLMTTYWDRCQGEWRVELLICARCAATQIMI